MPNDTYTDPTTGKVYPLKDFDDTRSWSKAKDSGFYGHMTVEKAHKGHKIKICGRGD